jgi:hypothetical protein
VKLQALRFTLVTLTTKTRLAPPCLPTTLQQPTVGNVKMLGMKPVFP